MLRYTFIPSAIQTSAYCGFFVRAGAGNGINTSRDQESASQLESPTVRWRAWRSRGFSRNWHRGEPLRGSERPMPVSLVYPIQSFTPGDIFQKSATASGDGTP